MVYINGTTKETHRRYNEGDSPDQREGLGVFQPTGEINGGKPFRANSAHCSGQSTTWADKSGNPSAGKILKRLKLIESEYLSYVQSHQQRLETRMEESKSRELAFKNLVKELEEEIYNLASQNQVSEEEQE